MRIVFMGTPDFAAASLQALLDAGLSPSAVYTQPDRPRGRGMKETPSPVKALAQAAGIPVFQPESLQTPEAAQQLRELAPDVIIVVAYGKILPKVILHIPPLGCINVHGSLLPAYRGAAPIQWAVLNGERETGVTVMQMNEGMDTGDILAQRRTEIGEFETSGALFDRLKTLGAALLCETVLKLGSGDIHPIPQEEDKATYTRQLDKSMCPIDWNKSPREIVKHIYGLQPWPVATTVLGGETLRIFAAGYTETSTQEAPGTVVAAGKQGLEIACGGGQTVLVKELQAPGKKRMEAAAWLLGHPVAPGTKL